MKSLLILMAVGIIAIFASMKSPSNMAPHREDAAISFAAKSAEVIAYRELHLKKGISGEKLEKFISEELTPTFEQYVPGVKAVVMKGARRKKGSIQLAGTLFQRIITCNQA